VSEYVTMRPDSGLASAGPLRRPWQSFRADLALAKREDFGHDYDGATCRDSKVSAGPRTVVARRTEAILEPDLPTVDSHHHLWDVLADRSVRYMLEDLLVDFSSGHNIIATGLRTMSRDVPSKRTRGDETDRRDRIHQWHRGDERLGWLWQNKVAPVLLAMPGLRLGARVRSVLEAHINAARERFRGIRHITAYDAGETFSARALLSWRRLVVPSSDRRADGIGTGVSLNTNCTESRWRPTFEVLGDTQPVFVP
jgi:hypothetical protein